MKPPPFAYHAPRTVDEVLAALQELGDDGKVLAGGQSLVPMLNMRLATPAALIDLAQVDGLDRIEVTDTHVRVEARVTHERLRRDPQVGAAVPMLRQALDWVAHPVIRNRGTSVGSIVHADPAAELPAVLGVLGGHMELASSAGTRQVAGRDYVLSPLDSDTAPDELAVAAVFPRPAPGTGSAFLELARRHGDYALAGVGATVTLDGDRRIIRAEVACIGVGGTPIYVTLTDALAGQAHDAPALDDAIAAVRASLRPGDDIHATGAYRVHLAGVLTDRVLRQALAGAIDQEIAA